jgi:serine/threonine protein kinase
MGSQQTIGHYRVTAKLGKGGMGELYRAIDTNLGRDLALKLLPRNFAQDPDRMAPFERLPISRRTGDSGRSLFIRRFD